MSNPFEAVKHDLVVVEGKKIVYRGYCRSNDNSVNLNKTTLYYLEPHGKNGEHAFVSNFPSASRTHMGVYQTKRFKLVSAELVDASITSLQATTVKEIQKEKEVNNDNQKLSLSNIEEKVSKLKIEEPEPVEVKSVKQLPFAEDLQEDNLAPRYDDFPEDLKWDEVYKASLRFRRSGYAVIPLGSYYIIRADNEHTCAVFKDEKCTNIIAIFPLAWFTNFVSLNELPNETVNEETTITEITEAVIESEEVSETINSTETLKNTDLNNTISIFDLEIKNKNSRTRSTRNAEEEQQLDLFSAFF